MSNFPNDAGVTRLVWAMLLEQNDEWSLNRRHMQLEGLQTLQGRPLAAVDGSYPAGKVEGQLSGGEIERMTGAGRPITARQASPKLPDARTGFFRVQLLRSSRSWPPGPVQERVLERDRFGEGQLLILQWPKATACSIRPGALPELRRRAQDHRSAPGAAGDREDPHALGVAGACTA